MLVFLALLAPRLVVASESASEVQQVKEVLSAAFAAETKGEYPVFYSFLSERAKAKLLRDDGVRTPEDYRKLRIKGEAKWLKNDLLSVRALKDHKYSAISRADVKETGEADQFCVRYVLVFEGAWKIDSWKYLDSCPNEVAKPKAKSDKLQ